MFKGVANEAFKKLQGDDAEITKAFAKRNREELASKNQMQFDFDKSVNQNILSISKLFKNVSDMPENKPEQVEAKKQEYIKLTSGHNWWQLKSIADIQTAQFFIPKTKENANKLITDGEYREYLSGTKSLQNIKTAKAMAVSCEKVFFHWFLEFPEIFISGGFDCILGNPPFLGGQKLTGTFGASFLEYVKHAYSPAGSCDIVTYFFRRIFNIIKSKGFQALISTNTIAQGAAREGGLEVILKQDGSINFAIRSTKWPGLAAVEVSLLSIFKGKWNHKFILNNKLVSQITAYLDDSEEVAGNPYPLQQNVDKSFQGSIVLGKGFILESKEAMKLIEQNPKNKDVLFPYLNGDDLNTNPDQSPSRWVINFFDWPEEKCRKGYPECFEIIERLVKPERIINNDKVAREKWWLFLRMRHELYRTIAPLERVLVVARVGKYQSFIFSKCDKIFHEKIVVNIFCNDMYSAILNSEIYQCWIRKYSSTLGGMVTVNYSPSDCFDTFAFPQNLPTSIESTLENIGSHYHEHRKQLMLKLQLGLTKTYNQFHNQKLDVIQVGLSDSEIEKKYGKETLILYKHLNKTKNTCSFNEAVEGIIKLRLLHKEMDEAVLKAYGWTDIILAHDFYEVDYLPENDRIRYTISPETRKEILKRLLLLNHEIHKKEMSPDFVMQEKKKPSGGKKKKSNNKKQLSLSGF